MKMRLCHANFGIPVLWGPVLSLLSLAVITCCLPTPASAEPGQCHEGAAWHTLAGPNGYTSAYLLPCGIWEPAYIIDFHCEKGGETIVISLENRLSATEHPGDVPVTISIGSSSYSVVARPTDGEMTDTLDFDLAAAPGLMEAMVTGERGWYTARGTTTHFHLKGSKEALSLVQSRCAAPSGQSAQPTMSFDGSTSYWDHNGSVMRMDRSVSGGLSISYEHPRPGLGRLIVPGQVLLNLTPSGTYFVGTALVFKQGCGAAGYSVTAEFADPNRTVLIARGAAPIRRGCAVVGYRQNSNSTLVFTRNK